MITIVSVLICRSVDLVGEILSYFFRRIGVFFRYSEIADIAAVRVRRFREIILEKNQSSAFRGRRFD
jgi:hypothetical protein